jgi:hypothetical protein
VGHPVARHAGAHVGEAAGDAGENGDAPVSLGAHRGDDALVEGHVPQGIGLECAAHGRHVDVEGGGEFRIVHPFGEDASVRHDGVDAPRIVQQVGDQRPDFIVIGHVEVAEPDIQPLAAEAGRRLFAGPFVARGEDDPVTQPPQLTAGLKSQAPVRTGDQGDPSAFGH